MMIRIGNPRGYWGDHLDALRGGGTRSLMVDPLGKTMSQTLLEMKVKVPRNLLRGL